MVTYLLNKHWNYNTQYRQQACSVVLVGYIQTLKSFQRLSLIKAQSSRWVKHEHKQLRKTTVHTVANFTVQSFPY